MKINFIFDDKTKHVLSGAFIAIIVALLKYIFSDSGLIFSCFLGFSTGTIIGALKELIFDKLLKLGSPTFADFLATFYGSFMGAVLTAMIFGFIIINTK